MNPKPRIYISSPVQRNLNSRQRELRQDILDRVQSFGFDAQEFGVSGLPQREGWNFTKSAEIMSRCHGAIILAFAQWDAQRQTPSATSAIMSTEYNHFEGALSLALGKETLIVKEDQVAWRGIAYQGGGPYVLSIPYDSTSAWFDSPEFQMHFSGWKEAIEDRHHVFFGYSGGAADTANRIIRYLTSIEVTVRDWRIDFQPAGTILDEIEEAARTCLGGVFLFSKDDELVSGDTVSAAPRDNVIFEAGYFMHAVGRERTLIIREEGAKMPADVGGGIYLPLQDRQNTSAIETQLRRFIETRI